MDCFQGFGGLFRLWDIFGLHLIWTRRRATGGGLLSTRIPPVEGEPGFPVDDLDLLESAGKDAPEIDHAAVIAADLPDGKQPDQLSKEGIQTVLSDLL